MRKLLILFIFSASIWACENPSEQSAEGGKPLKAATLVEVILAQESKLTKEIRSTGNLQANESTNLSTEIGGIVAKINFEEGQAVKQGQLLLSLKNQDLQAQLSELNATKSLAEKKAKRSRQLFEAKGISQEALDEAETSLESINAQRQNLLAELEKTKAVAPFDGFVGLRSVSLGDYLGPNSSFASLIDYKPIKISFSIPEKYLSILQIGDSIEFESPNLSTRKKALVYAIEPQVDASSRTIQAKAKYANEDGALLPGGFVTVFFQTDAFENTIVIPNQAIVPELDGKKVFLVKNGKIKAQKVVSGIRRADQIQIIEGLNAGDSVVSSGLLQIREGIPVRVRMDKSYQKQASE